jgi:hypothetical protein
MLLLSLQRYQYYVARAKPGRVLVQNSSGNSHSYENFIFGVIRDNTPGWLI